MDRCTNCNKKIGIICYKCRCSNNYCIKCRMPESHNCKFDYKEFGKNILNNNLPKIIGDKIIKI